MKCSVHAAADDQPETHQPFERGNGPRAMVGDPRLLAAGSAAVFEGLEPDLGGGRWTGLVSCHERVSSEVVCAPAYADTQPRSRQLCRPRKKPIFLRALERVDSLTESPATFSRYSCLSESLAKGRS